MAIIPTGSQVEVAEQLAVGEIKVGESGQERFYLE
jgi:hypothetical protein